MEFNQLPDNYDEAKLGPQKRQTEFESEEAKLQYDARNLIAIAKTQSERTGMTTDPIAFARRKDNDIEALRAAIAREQQQTVNPGLVDPASTELSPEQMWLRELETRFNALPQLHKEIQWTDVEKSLRADPEAMRKLQALDLKGHAMNVFGEEGDEFIFASGWNNYAEVSEDHRNIVFDKEAQDWLAESYPSESCNGNAVGIIAAIMGVKEDEAENYLADPKFHEQLRNAIAVNGCAWLKTDAATREIGYAFRGYADGYYRYIARYRNDAGSFRAALRVKKT